MEIDRAGRFLEYSCSAQFLRRKKIMPFFKTKSLLKILVITKIYSCDGLRHICAKFFNMTDLPFCRFLQIRRKYKPKFQCFIFNIHWPRLTKQVCQKELKGFKWKGFEAA